MHEGRSRAKAADDQLLRPVRNRLIPVVAFLFLLGIFLAPHMQAGPWPWALVIASLPLGYCLQKSGRGIYAAVCLAFFAIGMLWAWVWLNPSAPAEGTYEIRGRVYGEPTLRTEKRATFLLDSITLDGQAAPGMAYCTIYTYGSDPLPQLFDGARLRFTGRVYHPQGKSSRHDFDFRMWMYQNRRSFGIASIQNLQIENDAEAAPWVDTSGRVRAGMRESLTRVMGDEAGFAMAMLVSDREGIREDERLAFQRTGIAHILSVSGLHVSILGGEILLALRKLKVRRGFHLPVMAVFFAAYCMLTGFSPATVRAAVMMLLVTGARALGRRPDPLLTLSTAMIVVLVINPLQLFSAGFVLSFSAMAGILLLNPLFAKCLGRGKRHAYLRRAKQRRRGSSLLAIRLKKRLGDPVSLLTLSLSAQLGVLLPTAAYFHQLPLYGLAINLVIVPLVGLLLPFYSLTLALSPLPYLGMAVGWLAKQATAGLLSLIMLLSTLPYAAIRVPTAPVWIACGAALCAVLLSWYFRGTRKARFAAIALTLALAFTGAYASRPEELRYIQLSVGQADAALIMDGSATVAVDVGEFGSTAAGYLLAEGRNLDAVFLTHLHLDHALGVNDLLDSGIAIGRVYLPEGGTRQDLGVEAAALLLRLDAEGIPVAELAAGDEVRYNKVGFTVLWPRAASVRSMQNANHYALALHVDLDGYSILSAGDLTSLYEAYAAIPCDVLKVSHHGSAGSTDAAFLDFTAPKIALISCASGDRALPAKATLDRLAARDISIYRTDETGDITLSVTDGQLRLTTYKARDPH